MNAKAKIIVPVVALLAILGIGIGAYFLGASQEEAELKDNRIPYAQGVVLMEDTEIEPAKHGWIDLTYNYQAFSKDGVNFSCLLSNAPSNQYDLYFDLYADAELTDEIFLSGLLKPGTALEEIALTHALPVGTTPVYVSFNQVDTDEEGNQTIINQTLVMVDFIVVE